MLALVTLLLQVVQVATVLLYAALAALLIRSGNFITHSAFTFYVLLMVIDLAWHPLTVREALFIEPWLLGLRWMSAIEAIVNVLGEWNLERRYLVLFLLFIGAACGFVVYGYSDYGTLPGLYAGVRQQNHVAIAALCSIAAIYWLFQPRTVTPAALPHFYTFTAYMVLRAAASFWRPATLSHTYMRTLFLAGSSGCMVVWIRVNWSGARLKSLYTRLERTV